MAESIITQDYLRQLFVYLDGHLIWKEDQRANKVKGKEAGCISSNGYIYICINKKIYSAHRLVYLYHFGNFDGDIDHINGVRNDNHIENLRIATKHQNRVNSKLFRNNKSQHKNVSWYKIRKQWRVQFAVNGKPTHFGQYNDIDYAIFVADFVRHKLYGEYARKKENW